MRKSQEKRQMSDKRTIQTEEEWSEEVQNNVRWKRDMSEDKEILKISVVMNIELSEASLSFQQITVKIFTVGSN